MKHSAAKAALVALGYKHEHTRYHGPASTDLYVTRKDGKLHSLVIFRATDKVDDVKVYEEVTIIP